MDVNAELLRSSFRSLFDDKIFKAGKGFEVDTEVLRDIFVRLVGGFKHFKERLRFWESLEQEIWRLDVLLIKAGLQPGPGCRWIH